MIRLFFIVVIIAGGAYFLITKVFLKTNFKACGKCEGQGFWRGVRGEKERCDNCGGSGKVLG